tara:strand:- start:668 stop:973 length:306 start_codon:yes stop_codon:yes gene_type:complete
MAFATLTLEDKKNKIIKEAPVGFSWTTIFFGGFVPLFRGDWPWFFIMLIASAISFGLAGILFGFIYNRIYIQNMLKKGFKIKSYDGNKKLIESKAQIKLNK